MNDNKWTGISSAVIDELFATELAETAVGFRVEIIFGLGN